MEIVINDCYGGFGLSPLAIKELAKLKGKECYFFDMMIDGKYKPLTLKQAKKISFWVAHSVPNPQDYDLDKPDKDGLYKDAHKRAEKIDLDYGYNIDRADKDLIKVVKTLGNKANGECAKLKIVEIPNGVNWEIDEYDGMESIHEKHRSWD